MHCNENLMIQFPDLKAELFVNMLGYKEPDRVTVLRCLGECQQGLTLTLLQFYINRGNPSLQA